MRRGSPAILLMMFCAVVLTAAPAVGKQYLVQAGLNWSHFGAKLKPGDEIVLMSGRHHPASFELLRGTAERPIVIRGLRSDAPAIISAERYGIRMVRPRHVIIENILIENATTSGLLLDGAAKTRAVDETPDEPAGHIVLRNVSVSSTSADRDRHAIVLRQLDNVQIYGGTIRGWGGSGLEVIACRKVLVQAVNFIGVKGFGQSSGIRVRAGSEQIIIERCLIRGVAHQPICVGGGSRLSEFRPSEEPVAEDPAPDEPALLPMEATDVMVDDCRLEGGLCSIAFCHADDVRLTRCTLLNPTESVLSLRRQASGDPRPALEHVNIGDCLIVWQPDSIRSLLHLGHDATVDGLTLSSNLWWSAAGAESTEALGPIPGIIALPQVTDVDPQVSDNGHATNPEAGPYGAVRK